MDLENIKILDKQDLEKSADIESSVERMAAHRLEKAWSCILQKHLPLHEREFMILAENTALENGYGISLFKFLSSGTDGKKEINCHYMFLDDAENIDKFSFLTDHMKPIEKNLFRDKFNKSSINTLMSVCISIPVDTETFQSIKIFKMKTYEEVDF